jgi:carnitine O-palmitoyltransferase 2
VTAAERGAPLDEQAALLRAAAARHSRLAKAAATGRGFDRHLFALRAAAAARGGELPPLFADPSYATLSGNELSTSTLTTRHGLLSAFGPVHAEGFGVAYAMPPSELHFCVSAYKPWSARAFADELEAALIHVEALLAESAPAGG